MAESGSHGRGVPGVDGSDPAGGARTASDAALEDGLDAGGASAPPDEPAADDEPKRARNADFVQSLERGLAVIRAFGPDRTHLTLSDVARETNLTRAAARRFLLTLLELGYIDFDGRLFSLRPRVLELGYSYMSTLSFSDIALPAMRDLVDKTSLSASLAVLDRDEAVYIAHVSAKRILAITVSVGTRVPAYATALGQVLLAALPNSDLRGYLKRANLQQFTPQTVTDGQQLAAVLDTVRKNGHAVGDEGLEMGLRALAVPVTDARERVVASLGVSTQASSVSSELLQSEHLPVLQATADQISSHLRAAALPVPQ